MNRKALLTSIFIVLVWRVITSVIMFLLAQNLQVHPLTLTPEHTVMYNALQNGSFFDRNFLLPWFRWDTFHYISIATSGYTSQDQTVWPPLFPAFIAALAGLGLHPLVAALLISTVSSIVVIYNLFLLVEEEKICSPNSVLFFLLTFPVAFYLLAGYSEALFLALSLACLREARKGRLMTGGILAFFAALTRQLGVLLALPLFMEGLRASGFQIKSFSLRRFLPAVGFALLPLLGFISFSLYVHFGLGYGYLWDGIAEHGRRFLVAPGWGIVMTLADIINGKNLLNPFAMAMDAVLSFLACMLFILGVFRKERLPASFLAYLFVNLLVIIMFMMENKPLGSAARYLLVLFPIFLLQAQLWKSKISRLLWFAFSLISNVLLFGGFYAWLWIE
jgi:hypothetical protein